MLTLLVWLLSGGAQAAPLGEDLSACVRAQNESADAELDLSVRLERRLLDPTAGAMTNEQLTHISYDDARIRQSVGRCIENALRQALPVDKRLTELQGVEATRATLDNFALIVGTLDGAELGVISVPAIRRAHFILSLRELQHALTDDLNSVDTVGAVLARFASERAGAVIERRQALAK